MAESPSPLSFPAILRNPALAGYVDRQERSSKPTYIVKRPSKSLSDQREGKRWIRRKDNAHFAGNPHIVNATERDYALQTTLTHPTFPEPLPPFLPRNARLPASIIPTRDPNSANAGRFSLSLKGMRRELRKSGFRAEVLVRDIELEVASWLQAGGTVLAPDASESASTLDLGSRTPVGDTGTIFEMSRTPLQLIWFIMDDAFARYIVHCCARYYEIISFSKEISGQRCTYLLRPGVVYPDHHAPDGLDTPPQTDADYSSQLDTESDRGSLDIVDSDVEWHSANADGPLSSISEREISTSSLLTDKRPAMGDTDMELESDAGLPAVMDRHTLLRETTSEFARIPAPRIDSRFDGQFHRRVRSRRSQGRSTSSPSPSPTRKSRYRGLRPLPHRSKEFCLPRHHRQTFYDYLFS